MSVKYTATWTCDGCKANVKVVGADGFPPPTWATVTMDKPIAKGSKWSTAKQRHYCAKCAKEKGL